MTLLLALALTGLLTGLGTRALGMPEGGKPPPWILAGGTGLLHVAMVVALVPLLRAHAFRWREAFGFLTGPRFRTLGLAVALTIPAMAAAWAVHQGCGWLLDRLAIPHDTQAAVDAVRAASQPWERAVFFLFAAGTAPVVEELLFRGVVWPLARDRGWRVSGCLAAALLFALVHFNAAALVPLWLLGIFWTWLYEVTGDLTAPIVSHALFNATNFAWIVYATTDIP